MNKFFDQLVKKCDCHVKYHDNDYYRGWYSPAGCFESGQYFDGEISILSELSPEGKEGVLAHEMGHHWHCKQISNDDEYGYIDLVLKETIAELYALHLLLRNKRKEALKYRFSTYEEMWFSYPHLDALEVIKRRRIWKRCEQFLKEG